jgi:crossover junction endodeoxyribonuclease RuvC
MKILGIDPGTARTGYGIIRSVGDKLTSLNYGCIETSPDKSDAERLIITYKEISKILRKEKPHIAVIERLFFFMNMKTVMTVSQSRGVVLMACAQNKIPIFEYTPLEIKQSLTGYGRAKKKEVQESVKKILKFKEIPKPDDAADALAIAICYHLRRNCKKKN